MSEGPGDRVGQGYAKGTAIHFLLGWLTGEKLLLEIVLSLSHAD